MPDCSKHTKEVAGISDMKVLAEMVGDLHYETLAVFLERLVDKLYLDATKDQSNGRYKLSCELNHAANCIYYAHINIESAWEISKPFMEEKIKQS